MKSSHREIERKFLIPSLPKTPETGKGIKIRQGYLVLGNLGREVRLRHIGKRFLLGVKSGKGANRKECEVPLRNEQFEALWPLTKGRRVTKTRRKVRFQGFTIEIDLYGRKHAGLIVAEVEFKDLPSCRRFQPPPWFGRDVTGESRYSNRRLAS